MNTPICDFVEKYAKEGRIRLHMPGHKGSPFLGVEQIDITEVYGADTLYMEDGIIKESLENAAALFGTKKTLYSAEGSSLCIRAMVCLLTVYAKKQGRAPVILAGRNAHKTFLSAAALCDVDVRWLYPESADSMLSCRVSAASLDEMLCEMNVKPIAVYITSPDYLGVVSDVRAMANVCEKHGVLLAVDNAHGSYLRFLSESRHPIDLGAHICCDSAHKTLPVLTGGAYLHLSQKAPRELIDGAENAMSLFASTSPSYLILQSLDRANQYLAEEYRKSLSELCERVGGLKKSLTDNGFALVGDEETKITIKARDYGYTGYEIADHLRQNGVESEFSDPDFAVLMFTPQLSRETVEKVERILLALKKKQRIDTCPPGIPCPKIKMTVREAMLSPSETVDIQNAMGRILASPSVACPPAVPIIACGEQIDAETVKCFEYYGIEKIRVVCQNPSSP